LSSANAAKLEAMHGPWWFRGKISNRAVVRMVFYFAVRVMVVKTMSLHDFQLDEKLYRQSGGGSIGLDLTGFSRMFICMRGVDCC
jgi:hypothetical protein